MNVKFTQLAILLALSIFTTLAIAGSEVGLVRFAHGQYASNEQSAGYTFFFLESASKSNAPACSTFASGERWVIDNDWPAAKVQIATLLLAATTGQQVRVNGANNCNVWQDTETAIDIQLN